MGTHIGKQGNDIMAEYEGFAKLYDIFMDETPYDKWAKMICDTLSGFGIEGGLALDLGCGTGSLTMLMAKAGYDMIGIDSSQDMLAIAVERANERELDILYLCQDMREFELYGTVGAVISTCDSINYMLNLGDLSKVFSLVNNYLDPGGIFCFDFNTDYKYREVIGDRVIAENREDCSFIWENSYYEDEKINEYDLTFFEKEPDGRYRKFSETHYQRGYDLRDIRTLLKAAGLVFVKALDMDTDHVVRDNSERIFVVARKPQA